MTLFKVVCLYVQLSEGGALDRHAIVLYCTLRLWWIIAILDASSTFSTMAVDERATVMKGRKEACKEPK